MSSCSSAGSIWVGSAKKRPAAASRAASGNSGRLCNNRWTIRPRLKRSRPAVFSGDNAGGSSPLGRDGNNGRGGSGSGGGGPVAQSGNGISGAQRRLLARGTGGQSAGIRGASPRPTSLPLPRSAASYRTRKAGRTRASRRGTACASTNPADFARFASRRYRADPAPGSERRITGGGIPASGASATPIFPRHRNPRHDRRAASTTAARRMCSTGTPASDREPQSCRAKTRSGPRAPWRHGRSGCEPHRAGARQSRV